MSNPNTHQLSVASSASTSSTGSVLSGSYTSLADLENVSSFGRDNWSEERVRKEAEKLAFDLWLIGIQHKRDQNELQTIP